MRIYALAAVLLCSVFSHAQKRDPFPRTIPVKNLEKLPLGPPQTLLKDLHPTVFIDRNNHLPSNSIKDIAIDSLGRMWFATETSGFGFIDHDHVYVFNKSNGFQDRVDEVYVALNGDVWLGGNGTGVFHIQGDQATWYVTPDLSSDSTQALTDVHIQDIKEDSQGNIWISTRLGGMSMFDGKRFHHHGPKQGFPSELVHSFGIDALDRVWCLLHDGSIARIDGPGNYVPYEPGYEGRESVNRFLYHQGEVVASCYWGRLVGIGKNGVESIHPDLDMDLDPDHHVEVFLSDESGRLWFMQGGKLNYWKDGRTVLVSDMGTNGSGGLNQLLSYNGKIWAATNNGLFCIHDFHIQRIHDHWIHTTHTGHLAAEPKSEIHPEAGFELRKVIIDDEGVVSFGSPILKLNEDDPAQVAFYSVPNGYVMASRKEGQEEFSHITVDTLGKPLPHVQSSIDGFQQLWGDESRCRVYGRYKGMIAYQTKDSAVISRHPLTHQLDRECFNNMGGYLFRNLDQEGFFFMDGELTRLQDLPSFKDFYSVSSWIQMPNGSQVASSRGQGILKIDADGESTMLNEGLSTTLINYGRIDRQGQVWFETFDGGVIFYNGGTPISITKEDGLSHNYLYYTHIDPNGNIWLGTYRGATVLRLMDPSIQVKNKADLLRKYQIMTFTKDNGLQDAITSSIFSDRKGNVWLDCYGVRYVISLDRMQHVVNSPGITLTDIQIMGRPLLGDSSFTEQGLVEIFGTQGLLGLPTSMTLDHTVNQIRFEFATNDWSERALFRYKLVGLDEEWSATSERFEVTFNNLAPGDYTLMALVLDQNGNQSQVYRLPFRIDPPFWLTWWFMALLIGMGILGIALLVQFRTRSMRRKQRLLKRVVDERTSELLHKNSQLRQKNQEIMDSIGYARRLQEAILPSPKLVKEHLLESFILYRPKDIVAGDFYWVEPIDGKVYFAAADCTGHGVPGAMVSVVCANALNRAVLELRLRDPGSILDKVTELVVETFEKSGEDVKDGMDIALCALDTKTLTLEYAGANNPLWINTADEEDLEDDSLEGLVSVDTGLETHTLKKVKANKQPVGKYHNREPFLTHRVQLKPGECIYIFTDGFADQFGGDLKANPQGKKFKYRPFEQMLVQLADLPMTEQKQVIEKIFLDWKGPLEQVDDVCVIGVRV